MCPPLRNQLYLAIAHVKRYLADNYDHKEGWDIRKKAPRPEKVAVIGSGPSGLQVALDLGREGISVTVFEKEAALGGMMTHGIPSYRLPKSVVEKEISYLHYFPITFQTNTEIGREIPLETLLDDYDAVVLAVGKQVGRVDKSLPHHNAKAVFTAPAFLKSVALGEDLVDFGENCLVVGGAKWVVCCNVVAR